MGASNSTPAYDIPQKMKRVVLVEPNPDMAKVKLELEEVDVPEPKAGEVLVKLVAAPVNPSDYGKWRMSGQAAGQRTPIGNEGAGVVVKCGPGATTPNWKYLGKKVGVVNLQKLGQGSYQEYVRVSVMDGVFIMPDEVDVQDAASFFVNPYTCVGICDTVKADGGSAFIHTAAASQLGQMIVKYLKTTDAPKLTVINVVRRQEQADLLKEIGAEHVVVTSEADWKETLAALIKEHKVTHAFDAIAGESSGEMLTALPPKGQLYIYGGLSEKPVSGINPIDLIYANKQVKGWFLSSHIREGGSFATVRRIGAMSKAVNAGLLEGQWARSQFVDCAPEELLPSLLKLRADGCTNQKLRVRWVDNAGVAALLGGAPEETKPEEAEEEEETKPE